MSLKAISPIDGRYAAKTEALADYFSEYALIRYRVLVEVRYLQALHRVGLPQLQSAEPATIAALEEIVSEFTEADAQEIKQTERVTNHDVKAVEYFVKQKLRDRGLDSIVEFTHFGLTSQDINNTAVPLSLKEGLGEVIRPAIDGLVDRLEALVGEWKDIPMLARTHGQPASPTLLGKEFRVWTTRLREQLRQLDQVPMSAKFGGATGNLNAHYVSFPDRDWHAFATSFVEQDLGLHRSYPTTQIEHYDNLAALFHALSRTSTILIDLCRDVWTYISMEYFRQRTVAGEIGSSAMPHKVNPIDFENAEGNLGIARALFTHLADKLPVSRLQRDLTDSTVLRNIGVPIAHLLISVQAMEKGLGKLLLNAERIAADLEANWMVTAEAIQNVLRREGYPQPYEALKELTRGRTNIDEQAIHAFIAGLDVSGEVKEELRAIRPENYVGRF
ncbi:adenylosuccinate lyase [Lewinella sp. JB7]|uniref:adenylosuccinate lyase n=1 Tax=Lewinella sp. JB7 TaxID=2962887 RepID=UPI0020CA1AE5|nr:adenylosuccinate lyase [Lewinella sp. JB7]MCP9237287.1 adenylosuccinate lyase [Lewinella sp. JB7]